MRKCVASVYQNGAWVHVTGLFHQWGSGFEEFESGPANYTVAIIELDNGSVVTTSPDKVIFLDKSRSDEDALR